MLPPMHRPPGVRPGVLDAAPSRGSLRPWASPASDRSHVWLTGSSNGVSARSCAQAPVPAAAGLRGRVGTGTGPVLVSLGAQRVDGATSPRAVRASASGFPARRSRLATSSRRALSRRWLYDLVTSSRPPARHRRGSVRVCRRPVASGRASGPPPARRAASSGGIGPPAAGRASSTARPLIRYRRSRAAGSSSSSRRRAPPLPTTRSSTAPHIGACLVVAHGRSPGAEGSTTGGAGGRVAVAWSTAS